MTTDVRPQTMPPTYEELRPRERRRRLIATLARPAAGGLLVLVLYFLLPLDQPLDAKTVLLLTLAGLGLIGIVVLQIRQVIGSAYPRLRAIGAIAITVPLFLVIFSTAYYFIARGENGAFSQPLNRVAGLYYTLTVFSTVGFGDITPKTEVARIVTMLQMIGDLTLLGIFGKVLLGAANLGLQRTRSAGAGTVIDQPPVDG